MPNLCCTSDFNGDGLLSVTDYRLYSLWSKYVDKNQDVEDQLLSLDGLYATFYPSDPVVVSVRIPTLLDPANCAAQHGWFVTPWHSTVELGAQKYGWLE